MQQLLFRVLSFVNTMSTHWIDIFTSLYPEGRDVWKTHIPDFLGPSQAEYRERFVKVVYQVRYGATICRCEYCGSVCVDAEAEVLSHCGQDPEYRMFATRVCSNHCANAVIHFSSTYGFPGCDLPHIWSTVRWSSRVGCNISSCILRHIPTTMDVQRAALKAAVETRGDPAEIEDFARLTTMRGIVEKYRPWWKGKPSPTPGTGGGFYGLNSKLELIELMLFVERPYSPGRKRTVLQTVQLVPEHDINTFFEPMLIMVLGTVQEKQAVKVNQAIFSSLWNMFYM